MEAALRKLSMEAAEKAAVRRRQKKRRQSRSASPRGSGGGVLSSLSSLAGYCALPASLPGRPPSWCPSAGPNIVISAGAGAADGTAARSRRRPRKKRKMKEDRPTDVSVAEFKKTYSSWVPASGAGKTSTSAGAGDKKTVVITGPASDCEKKPSTTVEPGSSAKLSRAAKQRQRKKMKRMLESQSKTDVSRPGQSITQSADFETKTGTTAPTQLSAEPMPTAASGGENGMVPNGSSAGEPSRVPKRPGRSGRRRWKRAEWRNGQGTEQSQSGEVTKPENDAVRVARNEQSCRADVNVEAEHSRPGPVSQSGTLEASSHQPQQLHPAAKAAGRVIDTLSDPASAAPEPNPNLQPRPLSYSARRRAKKRRRLGELATASESAAADKPPKDKPAALGAVSSPPPTVAASAEVSRTGTSTGARKKTKRRRLAAKFDNIPLAQEEGNCWKTLDAVVCESESRARRSDKSETNASVDSKPKLGTDADFGSSAGTETSTGTTYSARRRARKRRRRTESSLASEPQLSQPEDAGEKITEPLSTPSSEIAPRIADADVASKAAVTRICEPEGTRRAARRRAKRSQRRKTDRDASTDPAANENNTEPSHAPGTGTKETSIPGTDKSVAKADKPTAGSAVFVTGSYDNRDDKPDDLPSSQSSAEPLLSLRRANGDDSDNDSEKEKDRRWWWKKDEARPEGDERTGAHGSAGEKPLTVRAKRRQKKRRVKDRLANSDSTAGSSATANTQAGVTPATELVPKATKCSTAGSPSESQREPASGAPVHPAAAKTTSPEDRLAIRKARRTEKLRLARQRRRQALRELKAQARAAAEEKEGGGESGDRSAARITGETVAESAVKSEAAGSVAVSVAAVSAAAARSAAGLAPQTPAPDATLMSGTGPVSAAVRSATAAAASAKSITTSSVPVSTGIESNTAGTEPSSEAAAAHTSVPAAAPATATAAAAPATAAAPVPSSRRRQRRRRGHPVSQPGRLLMGGTVHDPLNLASLQSPDETGEQLPKASPLSDPANVGLEASGVFKVPDPPAAECARGAGTARASSNPTGETTADKSAESLPAGTDSAPVTESAQTTESPAPKEPAATTELVKATEPSQTTEDVKTAEPAKMAEPVRSTEPAKPTEPSESSIPVEHHASASKSNSSLKSDTSNGSNTNGCTPDPDPTSTTDTTGTTNTTIHTSTSTKADSVSMNETTEPKEPDPTPDQEFDPRKAQFQYGNYNRYYGYRNAGEADPRLACLRAEWFAGLDVLDVGCNIGHVTLTVARDYRPRRCVGLDIDSSLIKIARKNVKHYTESRKTGAATDSGASGNARGAGTSNFPKNVSFVHANFVLESDALLETVRPEFDTVLCLSITKWVHLNFGDDGLRRFLRRVYLCLRPGGRLLLEPQPWNSYLKYKKLTPQISATFSQLRLRPAEFPALLCQLGFLPAQLVGEPQHAASGFSRQLQLFVKPGEGSHPSPENVSTAASLPAPPSSTSDESSPNATHVKATSSAAEKAATEQERAEVQAEADVKAKAEVEAVVIAEGKQADAKAQAEAEVKAQTEAEVKAEAEVEAVVIAEGKQADAKAQAEAEVEAVVVAEGKQTDAKAQAEAEVEAVVVAAGEQAEAKAQSDIEAMAEAEVEAVVREAEERAEAAMAEAAAAVAKSAAAVAKAEAVAVPEEETKADEASSLSPEDGAGAGRGGTEPVVSASNGDPPDKQP